VVEDGDQWRALVNMLMKLPLPYNAGIFILAWKVLAFRREVCFVKYVPSDL
jgi:hypothetical protein